MEATSNESVNSEIKKKERLQKLQKLHNLRTTGENFFYFQSIFTILSILLYCTKVVNFSQSSKIKSR